MPAGTASCAPSAAGGTTSSTSAASSPAASRRRGAAGLRRDRAGAAPSSSRREFTANVSHELKTPLQGIIGSAELLENGMVKPRGSCRASSGTSAARPRAWSTLIGDIIRLSQLDEGDALPDASRSTLLAARAGGRGTTLRTRRARKNVDARACAGEPAPMHRRAPAAL